MAMHEKLQLILAKHPAGAPASESFLEILRTLFTEEEVRVALGMAFIPRSAAAIAQAAGVSESEARSKMEAMADKGIIYARQKGGETAYALLPTIPGVFEFPFMKGGGTAMHEKLGRLWEKYHREALGHEFAGSPTPFTRVIPIERLVDARAEVLPFEAVSRMFEQVQTFALAHCACRTSVGKCERPREVCLIMDKTGEFLIERKFAKRISREEALAVVAKSEEAGLVHITNNSQDRLNLICNCCPCCCTILRGLTELANPRAFAKSRWQAEVDAEGCNACGICEDERCPVKAIQVKGETAEVNPDRCIGCGLCATACPTAAIAMVPRAAAPETPATVAEMALKIAAEKGRTQEFLDLMKK